MQTAQKYNIFQLMVSLIGFSKLFIGRSDCLLGRQQLGKPKFTEKMENIDKNSRAYDLTVSVIRNLDPTARLSGKFDKSGHVFKLRRLLLAIGAIALKVGCLCSACLFCAHAVGKFYFSTRNFRTPTWIPS